MRMAAVFTLTTVTILRRTQIASRWLTLAGLGCAVVLLVGIGITPWVELLFPLWILALSLDILSADVQGSGSAPPDPAAPDTEPPGPLPAAGGASLIVVPDGPGGTSSGSGTSSPGS
jgi:hypothetical protein